MTPGQTALVGRLRVLLAGEAVVREVSMFGAGRFGVRVFADGGAGGSAAFRADQYRPSGKRRASHDVPATGVNLEALALAHG